MLSRENGRKMEDGRAARTTMITEENDTLLLLPDELNLDAY